MKKVIVYGTAICPYCVRAKELLARAGIAYEEIRVDLETSKRTEMEQRSGRRTVPQIFIGDKPIGGFDDLKALSDRGELAVLLQ